MASFTSSFVVGSVPSARSVRDAIQSYRRAQYLVVESTSISTIDPSFNENDEEAQYPRPVFFDDDDESDVNPRQVGGATSSPRLRVDSFFGEFDWDDAQSESRPFNHQLSGPASPLSWGSQPNRPHRTQEDSPLLRKGVPSSTPHLHKRPSIATNAAENLPQINENDYLTISHTGAIAAQHSSHEPPALVRRTSALSARSVTYNYGGKSTFGQTLFNSIAILLGVGMLSEPLAFAYAGWAAGTVLVISYGYISCYTAKILAKIILSDPRLRSYSDIGQKAFGPRSTIFISIMFCLELFAVSVILVTLYADSLHAIKPEYSADMYKVWGLLFLIPTVFLPLSLLSYTSILGIISTILLVIVILIDGFSKKEAPGSFWDPAETSFAIASVEKLGAAFGLFMAGFSGHVVVPSLARDMIDPTQFDRMIDWAFIVATFIYALIGWAGYTMFGNSVSDEISVDLLRTPGYDPRLNLAALWMLVLGPLSKFALNTQPLNATLEVLLGLDPQPMSPEARKTQSTLGSDQIDRKEWLRRFFGVTQRIFVTLLSVTVSIWVPEFSAMMAFLGSFSAFLLSVIGPLTAKCILAGKCTWYDGLLIATAGVMAVWGTWAAFLSTN